MKQERIQEIVESYLSGNISWVKKQIKTKQQLAEIAEYMRMEHPEKLGLFLRTMAS